MKIPSTWRIRLAGLIVMAVAVWQSRAAHEGLFREPWSGLPLALILVWVAALFSNRRRRPDGWVVGLLVAVSALLVRIAPGMTVVMIMSVGAAGARMSWRWLQLVGVPLVLAGALWMSYPVSLAHLSGFMDNAITLTVVLLLGRFSRDSEEGREAQAKALTDLQRAHSELQRYAAQVEELSALRERSRVARELHDTLGHALSAITVQIEGVRRLNRRDPGAVDPMLVETQALAREAMQELRQYLAGLRADSAGRDLVPTLEALAREAAGRNGWQLTLELGGAAEPVGEDVRRALVQIAREALTNVERHAGARSVTVRLGREGDELVLAIADDGRGFVPDVDRAGHYGLQGMRERLAELHGELVIQSRRGEGSLVIARLPAPASGR